MKLAYEITEDYPGLIVHDGRQSGAITIGHTRLPISAVMSTIVAEGWSGFEKGWGPVAENYDGYMAVDLSRFLGDLFDVRKEVARLVLSIANWNRGREDSETGEWLPPDAETEDQLRDALVACLESLDGYFS